jgi:uncharacterized membrane protein YsdA (DUF1294 family)
MISFENGIVLYVLVINVLSFAFFGLDKMLATQRSWRVSEKMLWILSLLGGSVGALIGMQFFRHKTKKISFQFILALIIVVQIILLWLFFGDF